jgi:hypothetical protein
MEFCAVEGFVLVISVCCIVIVLPYYVRIDSVKPSSDMHKIKRLVYQVSIESLGGGIAKVFEGLH